MIMMFTRAACTSRVIWMINDGSLVRGHGLVQTVATVVDSRAARFRFRFSRGRHAETLKTRIGVTHHTFSVLPRSVLIFYMSEFAMFVTVELIGRSTDQSSDNTLYNNNNNKRYWYRRVPFLQEEDRINFFTGRFVGISINRRKNNCNVKIWWYFLMTRNKYKLWNVMNFKWFYY